MPTVVPAGLTGAIAKALARSLAISVIVGLLALALWQLDPLLATLFLIAGSAVPLLRAYRAPWPVTTLACVVPAVTTLACFGLQLALLPAARIDPSLGAGLPLGVLAGWASARAHHLEPRAGRVYAQRTAGHLAIWLVTLIVAEGGALWGSELIVRAGLTGGMFSTAMVLAFAVTLRVRSARAGSGAAARVSVLVALALVLGGARVASAESLPAGTYAGDPDPDWLASVTPAGSPPVASGTTARIRINADGTAELLGRVEFRYGTASTFVFEPAPPPAPTNLRGRGRVVVTENQITTTRDFTIDATPRPDGSYLLWLPNPVWVRAPGGGVAFMTQRCPWVIRGGDAPIAATRDTPDRTLQIATAYAQFTQQLAQVRARLRHRGLSDDAVKAGVVAALLLLLAGATARTANALALGVATRREEELRPPGEPTIAGQGRRILSGREAREWLASRGLARDDRLTTEFWHGWYHRPWSESDRPPPFGLVAMAGRWGRKDVLGDDLTIVIDQDPPEPPLLADERPPPPPPPPPPPEEGPPPPHRRRWPERHHPPPVKVPCLNERLSFEAEQRAVTELHHELQRLDEEIERLEQEWDTARKVGAWSGLIDVGFLALSSWSLLTGAPVTVTEPFAEFWTKKVAPAVAEALVKEALKLGVRLGYGEEAKLRKLLESQFPGGGTKKGILEVLKSFLVTNRTPAATAELAAKRASSVWSGITSGAGVYRSMQKCELLRAQRRHAQALRRDTKLAVMDAEERRDLARARLRTCTQDAGGAS